jgi:hypothetical protein
MKVFLRHITEEKQLAMLLKEHISEDFIGAVEVFVSSDGESISGGKRWMEEIETALNDSAVSLILCSQQSIRKPWVNFECGASWIRRIDTLPICHSNISRDELPPPYGMLQAVNASEPDSIEKVYAAIAKNGHLKVPPRVDFEQIRLKIQVFERQYGLINRIQKAVRGVLMTLPDLSPVMQPNSTTGQWTGDVDEWRFNEARPHLNQLVQEGMLSFWQSGPRKSIDIAYADRTENSVFVPLLVEVHDAYRTIVGSVMTSQFIASLSH